MILSFEIRSFILTLYVIYDFLEINANRKQKHNYDTTIVSLNFIWTCYINIAFQLKSVENCVNVRAQLQSLFIVKPDPFYPFYPFCFQ